jgi:hypothetical protein
MFTILVLEVIPLDVGLVIKTLGPTYLTLAGCIVVACVAVFIFSKSFGLLRAWYYSVSVGSSVRKTGIGEDWDWKAHEEKLAEYRAQGLVR